MFDLNELPDNEGPAGRASALLYSFAAAGGRGGAAAAGGGGGGRGRRAAANGGDVDEDDDVVVGNVGRGVEDEEEEEEDEEEQEDDDDDAEEEERQVYYRSGANSTKIVCRLLRDDEAKAKDPPQSFLRLDNPQTICYPNDWQPSELTTFDENDEIDTDNEVTVAALDARAILDSQIVSRLDSAVSLVVPTEPSAGSFGIAPRPDKLGQRTESSRKYSSFTNFHRSHPKWEGVVLEKRGNDRLEDGLNLDSRQPLLHPGLFSSRKGKRAREGGNLLTVDTVLKLKRHARPTPALVVADTYSGAGPSLSMSLDQEARPAENSPFSSACKISSKGEGMGREGASLSLGGSSLASFESTAVVKRAPGHRSMGSKSNLGLSVSGTSKGENTKKVEVKVHAVRLVGEDQGHESGAGVERIDREVVLGDFGRAQPSEKLVWQGKLFVQGYSATDVTAYCSVDLQPESKLWSLPQAVTVENLVKIQEFFAAAKQAHVIEPVMRLRLLPDGGGNGPSFSSMVTILNSKMKGRAKDRSLIPEMLGWQTGSPHWRNGPPAAAAGSDYVFIASPKLKQPQEVSERTSTKLYLVLGSSLELVSTVDRELGNKLNEGVYWSYGPEENYLFGFLCIYKEEGRVYELSRSAEAKAESSLAGVDISPTKEPDVPSVLPLNETQVVVDGAVDSTQPEGIDALEGSRTSEGEDAITRVEKDEEGAEPDGVHPNVSKDQKVQSIDSSNEARRLEKAKGKKENDILQSPTRDEGRKDRDRQRDRDRDLRVREKEKDHRVFNKDIHRYLHRSSDKAELSKRDRSKDKEGDRFKERSHRDSHRDSTERSKSSRERTKELDKEKDRQRDKEKEKEREKPVRKRALSVDPELGTPDDVKSDAESEKATTSSKKEESEHKSDQQAVMENRKRTKVDSENTHENDPAVSEVNTAHREVDDTNLALSNLDSTTEPVEAVPHQDSRQAGEDKSRTQVTNSATVESLGDTGTRSPVGKAMNNENVVQAVDKDVSEKGGETLPGCEEETSSPCSSTHAAPPAHDEEGRALPLNSRVATVKSVVAEPCDTARAVDHEPSTVKESIQDMDKTGKSQLDEGAVEGLLKEMKDAEQVSTLGQNVNDGNVEVRGRAGDAGSIQRTDPEPSYNPKEEKSAEAEMPDDVQPSNSNTPIRADDMYCPFEGQKSEDNEVCQDSRMPPRTFLKDNPTPSVQKSAMFGEDDQHGNLVGAESPSSATDNRSSPDLSAEVSSEILLKGCDKETKSWLVSVQSTRYLAEEFGVRIARLEEIVQAKADSRSKAQQGPVDIKVFLVTEKSTDKNEGKWFINQAADVLQTLASRGVFTKCLWYQGHVQRYPGDPAPSIQGIVKRIKGEDGKNLEKIQEETGVMIGIVLHANNKNGTGNTTRVIGLRLKGTRKKGIQEATKKADFLLSQVAVQFSSGTRAEHLSSQDAALLKLKVDFSNNASPSSILTPMHKDVFAAYSPVSPVAALSTLGPFQHKLEEPSTEVPYTTASATATTSVQLPDSTLDGNPAASVGDFASQSQQSEDELPDDEHRLSDSEPKYPRPLLVSNLPERASASMLRELFEDVLKVKFGLPSNYEGVSDMILDVRFAPDELCAFVEFASDELLLEVLKLYADNKPAFFGLNLELGSAASLNKLERMLLGNRTETTSKGLEYDGDIMDSLKISRSRIGRKGHKSEDYSLRVSAMRSSPESDVEVSQDRRFSGRDSAGTYLRVSGEKPTPLFLSELARNSSAGSIHSLFEDLIKKYRNPSLGNYKGRATVHNVRFISSRGCAFVDLASAELVDFVLDLHSGRPELFSHMKMEIGRRPVSLGHGEEEPVVNRSSHFGRRNAMVEESHSYPSGRRARGYYPSSSPPPMRRSEVAVMDHDFTDDYEEEDEHERQPIARKRRSDPERTVYADRLPDNASEGMIRRIFERVLRDNMTDEQREGLGDNIITEVRYVPTKFCAFIVFAAEELTRLVLQLYNQDEEIFKNMRLKPHFHSRMEDLYREDVHDREDGPVHRVLPRDISADRRSRRGMDDYQNGYSNTDITDVRHRHRHSAAHRAVAATAFKEVDRRRSVYVDRIPERLPEPTVRDLFERAMREHRHGYRSHSVSQVTFFRDKFDPEKLCAFVELQNEDMVQELLDIYMEDEEAFSGMRVRPAIKYSGH